MLAPKTCKLCSVTQPPQLRQLRPLPRRPHRSLKPLLPPVRRTKPQNKTLPAKPDSLLLASKPQEKAPTRHRNRVTSTKNSLLRNNMVPMVPLAAASAVAKSASLLATPLMGSAKESKFDANTFLLYNNELYSSVPKCNMNKAMPT